MHCHKFVCAQTVFLRSRTTKADFLAVMDYVDRNFAFNLWGFLVFLYNYLKLFLFFKITNHEEVISQSLRKEDIKTKVVNYLSKV